MVGRMKVASKPQEIDSKVAADRKKGKFKSFLLDSRFRLKAQQWIGE